MALSLIPYKEITVVTFKPKTEVLRLLHDNVEIRKNEFTFIEIFTGTLDVPFYGNVTTNEFSIKRKGGLNSNMKVELNGVLHDHGYRTTIDVTMRFGVFSNIMLLIVALFFFCGVISALFGDADQAETIGTAISLVLLYVMIMVIFAWESRRVQRRLLELIRGEVSQ